MCVWVCAGRDPGVGYDERSFRWLLLDCDVCGHSSKSPAQVPAGIASHLYWRMGGGGGGQAGTVEDCSQEPPPHSLSEVGAGDSPSPISLSPSPPLPPPLLPLSFQVLGPGLVLWSRVWTLGYLGRPPEPRPWEETDTLLSSSVAPTGGLLGPAVTEPHQCALAGVSGVSGPGSLQRGAKLAQCRVRGQVPESRRSPQPR